MFTLLTTVVIGIFFAIFATQNTEAITLNFGEYVLPNLPVYLAVLTPLLIGLLVGFFMYTLRDLSDDLTINEYQEKIKKLKNDLAETTQKAHKLQIENSKLKKEVGRGKDENSI